MKIDLHIHSKDCSDGKLTLSDIFEEAHLRNITLLSITDHDNIECQEAAAILASRYGIHYISGVELNVSFSHPRYTEGKKISLDLLGYQYDIDNKSLARKMRELKEYRKIRAEKILEKGFVASKSRGITVHLVISTVIESGRVINGVDLNVTLGDFKEMIITEGCIVTRIGIELEKLVVSHRGGILTVKLGVSAAGPRSGKASHQHLPHDIHPPHGHPV